MSSTQNVPISSHGSKNSAVGEMADFRLYMKGMNPNSVKALITAKAICDRNPLGRIHLEIVNSPRVTDRVSEDADLTYSSSIAKIQVGWKSYKSSYRRLNFSRISLMPSIVKFARMRNQAPLNLRYGDQLCLDNTFYLHINPTNPTNINRSTFYKLLDIQDQRRI
jgi:hypothetical protein